MKDYVREYFDRHAEAWVEQAYIGDRLPAKFPVGPERVRLAVEGVAPSVPEGGALCDLGCGGGQLLVHAARLGWRVTGVDVAPAMIEEARELAGALPVELVVAAYDETGLPDGSFDGLTALGLIEYLPEDRPLFAEARRLLKPGGRFAVSCRNRLYNVVSANAYTQRELERGSAGPLLAELRERLGATTAAELRELAGTLALAGGDLAQAAELDASEEAPDLLDHPTEFAEERRQHTPSELEAAAAEHGFSPVGLYAVHPHPLPPGLEPLAPRTYNRLALAWQRPLESSPVGLAFCSAFVAVFEL